MPIISEVWQGAGLFLQRIDPNIFDDNPVDEDVSDTNLENERSDKSIITTFFASIQQEDLNLTEDTMNIEIESFVETNVGLVGLQVWRGALFLADYIIMHSSSFTSKNMLELAAGTGLTSIVAVLINNNDLSKGNGSLICTDVDRGPILQLIERNFQRNFISTSQDAFAAVDKSMRVKVSEIDFFNEFTYSGLEVSCANAYTSNNIESRSEKGRTPRQSQIEYEKRLSMEELQNVDVIFAADVVYDEEITSGFFDCLRQLCILAVSKIHSHDRYSDQIKKGVEIFLSIEKRCRVTALKDEIPMTGTSCTMPEPKDKLFIQNEMQSSGIMAPNYDIFVNLLNSFIDFFNNDTLQCNVEKIRPSSVTQSFLCYERPQELRLFKLSIFLK